MKKNQFLPPLRHISYRTTVIVQFEVAIYGWSLSRSQNSDKGELEPKINNFGSATLPACE